MVNDLTAWEDTAEFVYYGIGTGNVLRRIACVKVSDRLWNPVERVEWCADWRTAFEINGVESIYQTTGEILGLPEDES